MQLASPCTQIYPTITPYTIAHPAALLCTAITRPKSSLLCYPFRRVFSSNAVGFCLCTNTALSYSLQKSLQLQAAKCMSIRGHKSNMIILPCSLSHTATACAAHASQCSLCSMQISATWYMAKRHAIQRLYKVPVEDCACLCTWTQAYTATYSNGS